MILLLTTAWLASNGQTGPVFQYTNPTKEVLRSLALEESAKGYAYRNYLVRVVDGALDTLDVSVENVSWIFDHLFLEEVYFEEEDYQNSGYDPTKNEMVPSIGHQKTMFVWVLRVGSYTIRLIKGDCGNILVAKVIRKIPPSLPIQEEDLSLIFKEEDPLKEKESSFSLPKDLATASREVETENPVEIPKIKKVVNWKPIIVVSGITIGTATIGTLAYYLINNAKKPTPITPDTGGPAGVPGHGD